MTKYSHLKIRNADLLEQGWSSGWADGLPFKRIVKLGDSNERVINFQDNHEEDEVLWNPQELVEMVLHLLTF